MNDTPTSPYISELECRCFAQIPEENFANFKTSVLEECGASRGVDESIFQDPKLLHLTVVTMANMGKADGLDRNVSITA